MTQPSRQNSSVLCRSAGPGLLLSSLQSSCSVPGCIPRHSDFLTCPKIIPAKNRFVGFFSVNELSEFSGQQNTSFARGRDYAAMSKGKAGRERERRARAWLCQQQLEQFSYATSPQLRSPWFDLSSKPRVSRIYFRNDANDTYTEPHRCEMVIDNVMWGSTDTERSQDLCFEKRNGKIYI